MRAALFKRNHIECRRMRVINVVDLYLYPAPLYWVPPLPAAPDSWHVDFGFWVH